MGPAPFSTSRRIIFLDWICVLRAQKCWTAAALLLLLRLITLCSCLGKKSLSFVCLSLTIRTRTHPDPVISPSPGEECVLGVVGRPVSLPCLQPKLLSLVNFSIEWRRGDAVVLRSVFERSRNVEELGADSAAMSDDAAQTGNFSLELPTVDPREAPVNYSLFIISKESRSAALCTVCLQIAGQCQAHRKCSGERVRGLTPVCLQPVSAGRCCRDRRRWLGKGRRPSSAAPAAAFLNPKFTGSSTSPRSPPRAR